jgi:hypothetical protein
MSILSPLIIFNFSFLLLNFGSWQYEKGNMDNCFEEAEILSGELKHN